MPSPGARSRRSRVVREAVASRAVTFEEAAETAVRQWRDLPAEQEDRPVSVYISLTIDFSLR